MDCFGLKLLKIGAIFFALSLFIKAAPTPQDQFLQIYFLLQEAENFEKSGQKNGAYTRYQEVEKRLKFLKENNPQWEPVIVNFRLNYVRDKIGALANQKEVAATKTPPRLLLKNRPH